MIDSFTSSFDSIDRFYHSSEMNVPFVFEERSYLDVPCKLGSKSIVIEVSKTRDGCDYPTALLTIRGEIHDINGFFKYVPISIAVDEYEEGCFMLIEKYEDDVFERVAAYVNDSYMNYDLKLDHLFDQWSGSVSEIAHAMCCNVKNRVGFSGFDGRLTIWDESSAVKTTGVKNSLLMSMSFDDSYGVPAFEVSWRNADDYEYSTAFFMIDHVYGLSSLVRLMFTMDECVGSREKVMNHIMKMAASSFSDVKWEAAFC